MPSLTDDLARHLSDSLLLRQGDRLLVAVSGGPDSMALLSLLRDLAPSFRFQLHVAHVDHRLRGRASDDDAAFVRSVANATRLPFHMRSVDVSAMRKRTGGSLETVARLARYESLEEMRREAHARVIVTGHHADDQVETVLMRALRGTSARGLAGIPAERSRPPVVRPLLPFPRRELREYLRTQEIAYREDASNDDLRITRNRIRNVVIPRLPVPVLQLIPRISDATRTFSARLDDFLVSYFAGSESFDRPDGAEEAETAAVVHCPHLTILTPRVRLAALSRVFETTGIERSADRLARVEALLRSKPGASVDFRSTGIRVVRDRSDIVFRTVRRPAPAQKLLARGGSVNFDSHTLRAKGPLPVPTALGTTRNEAWIDADRLSGSLSVRYWKPGDRFVPFGMHGSKKVSDFLRDEHVPVHRKASVPVIVNRDRIVWVCGYRPDERYKVTKKTRRVLQLTIQ